MRVDDIRGQLRRHGVSGISALRKPELVKTLVRTLRSGGAARRSSGPAGRAAGTKAAGTKATSARTAPGRAKAAPAKRTARKATTTTARKTTGTARRATSTARTTAARKAASGGTKAVPARGAAKAVPARGAAKAAPARGAGKAAPARAAAKAAPARGAAKAAPRSGAVRTGRSTARSSRSSQVISSVQDRPERPGRSLVTTDHDVIRRWARARGAKPATISGTEREGRAGMLTFNIPGYRESSRIREITWEEWFHTFDLRRLNLIYQEQLRDGRQSNFFRTESPDREDG
ncbi:hypothetical protein [Micromonospora radicis]|nr:hypothetical protein [Micromonospora radicis]